MIDHFQTIPELRAQVALWRKQGLRVGLVPTMGGLHAGHLSLVEHALANADRVVATIFVNPTQFGQGEDLESYPRQEIEDIAALDGAGAHGAFLPNASEVYPDGFSTRVIVDGLGEVLCGKSRPGHFDGVTQVVCKLLNQAQADIAVFGEKDWQQLTIIRRMVRDLDMPVEIQSVATKRDADGLALSSRNAYLSEAELKVAKSFNKILRAVASEIAMGGNATKACEIAGKLILEAGFDRLDYVECRDAVDLAPLDYVDRHEARIFGAAYLGRARLIDNHPIIAAT